MILLILTESQGKEKSIVLHIVPAILIHHGMKNREHFQAAYDD